MKQFLEQAMNTAAVRGARYADVRITESREQSIIVKGGRVETIGDFDSIGFGVREDFD